MLCSRKARLRSGRAGGEDQSMKLRLLACDRAMISRWVADAMVIGPLIGYENMQRAMRCGGETMRWSINEMRCDAMRCAMLVGLREAESQPELRASGSMWVRR